MDPSTGSGPSNIVQATGQVAADVIGGLKQQPMLLALVCLNAIAIGIAAWFLVKLSETTKAREAKFMELIEHCMVHPQGPPNEYR